MQAGNDVLLHRLSQQLLCPVKVGGIDPVKIITPVGTKGKGVKILLTRRIIVRDGQNADLRYRKALRAAGAQQLTPFGWLHFGKGHPQGIALVKEGLSILDKVIIAYLYTAHGTFSFSFGGTWCVFYCFTSIIERCTKKSKPLFYEVCYPIRSMIAVAR